MLRFADTPVTKPEPVVTKPRNETPISVTKPVDVTKPGRPSLGDRAMTGAERVRKHRQGKRADGSLDR
jgi:hypothetical protein